MKKSSCRFVVLIKTRLKLPLEVVLFKLVLFKHVLFKHVLCQCERAKFKTSLFKTQLKPVLMLV